MMFDVRDFMSVGDKVIVEGTMIGEIVSIGDEIGVQVEKYGATAVWKYPVELVRKETCFVVGA
jgi:preprotein translocase subunit YajC